MKDFIKLLIFLTKSSLIMQLMSRKECLLPLKNGNPYDIFREGQTINFAFV
jgi:hypothetical protein